MNFDKRLQKIERINKPVPTPHIAMIHTDNRVTISHSKHGKFELNGRRELQDFIRENDLDDMDVLIVECV